MNLQDINYRIVALSGKANQTQDDLNEIADLQKQKEFLESQQSTDSSVPADPQTDTATPNTQWTPENPGDAPQGADNAPEVNAVVEEANPEANMEVTEPAPQDTTQEDTQAVAEQNPTPEEPSQDNGTNPLNAQKSAIQTMLADLEQLFSSNASLVTRSTQLFRTKLEESLLWVEKAIKDLGL